MTADITAADDFWPVNSPTSNIFIDVSFEREERKLSCHWSLCFLSSSGLTGLRRENAFLQK